VSLAQKLGQYRKRNAEKRDHQKGGEELVTYHGRAKSWQWVYKGFFSPGNLKFNSKSKGTKKKEGKKGRKHTKNGT